MSTENYEFFHLSDLQKCVIKPILTSLEKFQERDSGWTLSHILNLTVDKYNPLHVGCRIELLREIKIKRAVIHDNVCFCFWSLVAVLHPVRSNTDRTSSYPHYIKVLNLTDIVLPMMLNQIRKFENQNNFSINVSRNVKKRGFFRFDSPI